jgi:hypothetical protein
MAVLQKGLYLLNEKDRAEKLPHKVVLPSDLI